jgi:hypothetical protein
MAVDVVFRIFSMDDDGPKHILVVPHGPFGTFSTADVRRLI